MLILKQENFLTNFLITSLHYFQAFLIIETSFREKIAHLKFAREMASFLIVENA